MISSKIRRRNRTPAGFRARHSASWRRAGAGARPARQVAGGIKNFFDQCALFHEAFAAWVPFIQPMLQETGAEIRKLPQAPAVLESGDVVIVRVKAPHYGCFIAACNRVVHGSPSDFLAQSRGGRRERQTKMLRDFTSLSFYRGVGGIDGECRADAMT